MGSGVNDPAGRAVVPDFAPARTREQRLLPRSVTGLDGRNSSEFATNEPSSEIGPTVM
jgi:hypothetical protein